MRVHRVESGAYGVNGTHMSSQIFDKHVLRQRKMPGDKRYFPTEIKVRSDKTRRFWFSVLRGAVPRAVWTRTHRNHMSVCYRLAAPSRLFWTQLYAHCTKRPQPLVHQRATRSRLNSKRPRANTRAWQQLWCDEKTEINGEVGKDGPRRKRKRNAQNIS